LQHVKIQFLFGLVSVKDVSYFFGKTEHYVRRVRYTVIVQLAAWVVTV